MTRQVIPSPPTRLLSLPGGVTLEYVTTGTGQPVTLFAHGLAGGIADTRPLGSGVPGTKVFVQMRGHGRSTAPGTGWRYADLAADLAGVAEATGAAAALGVSMGAGALSRLVAESPDRFRRLVFYLPAVLDVPRAASARARLDALASAIAAGSPARVAEVVAAEVPEALRATPAARNFVMRRVSALLANGLGDAVASLAGQVAVDDVTALSRVRVPALVIGCRGDDLHPVEVAERLAAALGRATLHVYDEPGPLWNQRADLRRRIAGFLSCRRAVPRVVGETRRGADDQHT